jgi:hypothetical protein
MFSKLRPRSIYDVLAAIAFMLAIGGTTAYAANTIGTDDVIDESLTGADIKGKATPFVDGTLTGQDIKDQTVLNADLASQVLSNSKIQNNAITGVKVQDGSLDEADLKKPPWQVVAPNPQAFSDPCQASTPATGVFCGSSNGPPLRIFWRNYGDPFETVRFFRDPVGMVHLEGLVQWAEISFNPTKIFLLPTGYRPAKTLTFSVDCKEDVDENASSLVEHGRVDVESDGGVDWIRQDNCDPEGYISLNGIDFRAEQ